MEVLFYDVRLNYYVPIISQQGEVAGKLQVELSRIAGEFPIDRMCQSDESEDSDEADYDSTSAHHSFPTITCRVSIKQVRNQTLTIFIHQNSSFLFDLFISFIFKKFLNESLCEPFALIHHVI